MPERFERTTCSIRRYIKYSDFLFFFYSSSPNLQYKRDRENPYVIFYGILCCMIEDADVVRNQCQFNARQIWVSDEHQPKITMKLRQRTRRLQNLSVICLPEEPLTN